MISLKCDEKTSNNLVRCKQTSFYTDLDWFEPEICLKT